MSEATTHLRYLASNRDPGTRYEAPSFATSNWTPSKGGLFRAVWVSVTGNVCVTGCDGSIGIHNNVPVGLWPIGGVNIIAANDGTNPTTATISTAYLEGSS